MSDLTELYISKTMEKYGKRKKDGKCVFCGEILEDGQYCSCRQSERVNHIFKRLNNKISYLLHFENDKEALQSQIIIAAIPQKFKGLNFSDFKITLKEQQQVLKIVKSYADDAITKYLSGENMLLIGNFGTGKTMLMSILCEELIYRYRFACRYFNAVELLYKVKNTFDAKSKYSTEEILKQYREPEFLFIDDIDKLNPTDYVKELIYGIVNYRIEKRLPIIISANSTIETLDTQFYGEAVISRLIENSKEIIFNFKNMRIAG